MHFLVGQAGTIDDGDEPRDLQQSPADVIVLSAADTELAMLACAHAQRLRAGAAPRLRLANLLHLKHNYSVDLYTDKTLVEAKLVIVRLLGGRGYWPYGIERLAGLAKEGRFELAVLPGDDKPDNSLEGLSTVSDDVCMALWALLAEGGQHNADLFLEGIQRYLSGRSVLPAPRPVLRAGVYERPGQDVSSDAPAICIVFYRALLQSGDLAGIDMAMEELTSQGFRVLAIYAASLRDPVCVETVRLLIRDAAPTIILNTTAFATSKPGEKPAGGILAEFGVPVLQVVLSSGSAAAWETGTSGLSPRDIAMHVALPEVDGRLLTNAVSFKAEAAYDAATELSMVRAKAMPDRVVQVAQKAKAWSLLQRTPPGDRKIAIVLANYPNRDARIANGVGLDTPASALMLLEAMQHAGYAVSDIPADGNTLIERLKAGPTNAAARGRTISEKLPLAAYDEMFSRQPEDVQQAVKARWGEARHDPSFIDGAFAISALRYGNAVVAIQPARGYNIDPKATYHDPALVPPHGYLAFYFWLRVYFGAHAVIHLGKHGNLEWLPGKALALSERCFPEVALGPLPNIYPFIVNDPGEGSQAKRRTSAAIVDHLTPAMTRAETYGPLSELETLVDEYYDAVGVDARRCKFLEEEILAASLRLGLDRDLGFDASRSSREALQAIDNHLCDIKELQIRDGLHTLGCSPSGRLRTDTLVAIARIPRGEGGGANASLQRALAGDLSLPDDFDPLDTVLAAPWMGPKPPRLSALSSQSWRTAGDTIERLELLAAALVAGEALAEPDWRRTRAVLHWIADELAPTLDRSGAGELAGVLLALDGRFVEPGPSGAPTRGRPDVLPTGRNFFSLDSRTLPTRAAWQLGRISAERVIERYCQDHGDWPRAIALSAWGTSNMRTGGDDIAQALALMGVAPTWDPASARVTGFEIIPQAKLGRPRIDVTFRVSGFFRDAFPAQMDLLDSAVRAVAALDEEDEDNPLAARAREDAARLRNAGIDGATAWRRATARIFGSMPGAYGAGLQALIDEKIWDDRGDLAAAYLTWGQYAYGGGQEGIADRAGFEARIAGIDAVLHNQDNREHDLLDSDDYYQFEGGLAITAKVLSGRTVPVYHNDHSRPERPVVRALEEEIGRVVRGRAANPKWLAGIMCHGYKGGFEIAATVDYLFAFAATTGAVGDHHFDALYDAYLGDTDVRAFLAENNGDALREIAEKFDEAIARGLWTPRRNSVGDVLAQLKCGEE